MGKSPGTILSFSSSVSISVLPRIAAAMLKGLGTPGGNLNEVNSPGSSCIAKVIWCSFHCSRSSMPSSSIKFIIFGYAPKDSEQRTVVFLDDVSCVSFIYGEQAVITFVREVQRMPRARGVVVRERSTTSRGSNRSRHRGGSRGVCDVLANDASCSCEMTIYRQNSNDRSSGSSDAASQQKTLFTVEAKRGATRKTRETDVVQFVKVPSSRIGNGNCSQCIALDYTSIDDALRNERNIQKAREYSRAQKLTDKLNKFSTFNLGCLLYTSPSPRDKRQSRMPSSA